MTAATDRELTCTPPARAAPPQPRPWEPESPAPWVLRYALAVGVTALVCAVSLTLDRVLGDHAPLILFAVAVMVSAWYGGLGPGLLPAARPVTGVRCRRGSSPSAPRR